MGEVELIHYGVKGMKWGRRDVEDSVERPSAAPPKNRSADGATTKLVTPKLKAADPLQVKANAYHTQAKKIAKYADVNSEALRAKYDDGPRFTPEQKATAKKVAIGTAIVGTVAVAAVGFTAYKTSPRILAAGKDEVAFLMEKKGQFRLGDIAKAEGRFAGLGFGRIGKANPNLLKNEAEVAALGRARILGILKQDKNFVGQLHPNDYGVFRRENVDEVLQGRGNLANIKALLGRKEVLSDLNVSEKEKLEGLFQSLQKAARSQNKYGDSVGLEMHWDKGVDLPRGAILKRLSTVAETNVRNGGFYAAHRKEDVESYKALLPSFWEGWGVGSPKTGGYLNHYQAGAAVKAPSGKESLGIFKSLIQSDDNFAGAVGRGSIFAKPLEDGALAARGWTESRSKVEFGAHAVKWAHKDDFTAAKYFDEVRRRGYNALIDFNDAGKLSKQPMRILDASIFKIVKNEPQTLDDFYMAAKNWSPKLIHILEMAGDFIIHRLRTT